jgi:hypothetical protein
MRKFGLFCFNLVVAVGAATLWTLILLRRGVSLETLELALRTSGWAGFVVGATVGAGAVLGPRPALPVRKCLLAQASIVATSVLGAFIASLFPGETAAAEHALTVVLARRGILWGAGLGALAGTIVEFVRLYFMRRRAARRT